MLTPVTTNLLAHKVPLVSDFGDKGMLKHPLAEVNIGTSPVAYDLKSLYLRTHRRLPSNMPALEIYDSYLVVHYISIPPKEATCIHAMGFETGFLGPEEAYIVDLFPQSRFRARDEAQAKCRALVGIEGPLLGLRPYTTRLRERIDLGKNAFLELIDAPRTVGVLSMDVLAPNVQCLGFGAGGCAWQFQREKRRIHGHQFVAHTLLVPHGTKDLSFRVRASLESETNWTRIKTKHLTDWLPVHCERV